MDRVNLSVVHDHGCAATVYGKKHGPCNCPAGEIEKLLHKECLQWGKDRRAANEYPLLDSAVGHFIF